MPNTPQDHVESNAGQWPGAKQFYVPPHAITLGLWLFIASLAVFFVAGLVAYGVIRMSGANSPPAGALQFPVGLWASTALLIASGACLHLALRAVRRERQRSFRRYMLVAGALTVGFLLAQAYCLPALLTAHEAQRVRGFALYLAATSLIVLHALHVIGGLVPLGVVTARALKGRYDHEAYGGVKHCTIYWHFLDVVWLAMFATFLATS